MTARVPGRIFTFYSYKGGTGRSMALANVAWMLASAGHRVLAIDWDMEAPGLHRYLHPFLRDPELTATPGVIDYVTEFANAATAGGGEDDPEWYLPYADLTRYAVSLDTDLLPTDATLDFISAGRQGLSYAARVNSFDWQSFWDRLGGAALLEEARTGLRDAYEYVLIDSRTGVSDTSGICTVALPDALVVAFTLNRQSIGGAAAVAQSVVAQRDRNRFRVYPVPMRVEFAEKDRLELARGEAQLKFDQFLWHVPGDERARYWGDVEVVYHPYYAYEEVLAVFADRPEQRTSLLGALEQVTSRLSDGQVTSSIPPPDPRRQEILARYQRHPTGPRQADADGLPRDDYVFLSAAADETEFVRRLTEELEGGSRPIRVWTAARELRPGVRWEQAIDEAIRGAFGVLLPVRAEEAPERELERQIAQDYGKPVVPLVLEPDAFSPAFQLAGGRAIDFGGDFGSAAGALRDHLDWLRSPEGERSTLTRQLDDARRRLGTNPSPTAVAQLNARVADLEARLARLPAATAGTAPTEPELLELTVERDGRLDARWRDARVTSFLALDDLRRRVLWVFTDLLRDGRLGRREELQTLGELLYAALCPGAVGSLIEQSLLAVPSGKALRLALAFNDDVQSLASLPWELLYRRPDDRSAGSFLVTRADLTMSRTIAAREAAPAPPLADPPANVLVVAYTPGVVAVRALEPLASRGTAQVEVLENRLFADVLDLIDTLHPAVVHIATTARADPTGEPALRTAGPDGVRWINTSLLVELLSGVTLPPPVVVLELHPETRPYPLGTIAAALVRLGLAAVLELDMSIPDSAGDAFFFAFYADLLDGAPIDVAVGKGRRHIARRADTPSFALPILYMNHPGPIVAGRSTAVAAPPPRVSADVLPPADVPATLASRPDHDPAVARRLRRTLESGQRWRTLERLAIAAAVSEKLAADILRNDDEVRFSVNKAGKPIVGLISRVGPS